MKFLVLLLVINIYIVSAQNAESSYYSQYSVSNFIKIRGAFDQIDFDNINYPLLHALMFHRTNEERLNAGLPELSYLKNLEISATLHSQDMVEYNFFSHTNPYLTERSSAENRAVISGIKNPLIAENIATNFGIEYEAGTPIYTIDEEKGFFSYTKPYKIIENRTYYSLANALIIQWMNSPGHRANILNVNALQLGCGACFYRDSEFNNMAMFKAVQNFQYYKTAVIFNY